MLMPYDDYGRLQCSRDGFVRPRLADGAVRKLPQNWRIAALGLVLGATLSGCATADKMRDWLSSPKPTTTASLPETVPKPSPAPAAPKIRRQIHEPRERKEPEKVASIEPNTLIGLDPAAVEHLLGAPSNTSQQDPSLVWTYAAPGCSFQIFFYPDIKTSSFHALKYGGIDGTGARLDNTQACIRNILTVKTYGPS